MKTIVTCYYCRRHVPYSKPPGIPMPKEFICPKCADVIRKQIWRK